MIIGRIFFVDKRKYSLNKTYRSKENLQDIARQVVIGSVMNHEQWVIGFFCRFYR